MREDLRENFGESDRFEGETAAADSSSSRTQSAVKTEAPQTAPLSPQEQEAAQTEKAALQEAEKYTQRRAQLPKDGGRSLYELCKEVLQNDRMVKLFLKYKDLLEKKGFAPLLKEIFTEQRLKTLAPKTEAQVAEQPRPTAESTATSAKAEKTALEPGLANKARAIIEQLQGVLELSKAAVEGADKVIGVIQAGAQEAALLAADLADLEAAFKSADAGQLKEAFSRLQDKFPWLQKKAMTVARYLGKEALAKAPRILESLKRTVKLGRVFAGGGRQPSAA